MMRKKVQELPLIEKVTHSPQTSFSFDIHTCKKLDFPWHFHPEFQLNLVAHGRGKRLVGDCLEDFETGDLILLGANITHFWKYDAPYFTKKGKGKAYVIHFKADFLGKDLFTKPELRPIAELFKRAGRGLRFYGETRETVQGLIEKMEEGEAPERILQLLMALYRLSRSHTYKELSSIGFNKEFSSDQIDRINAILNHIFAHFTENLSLDVLAKMFFMTPTSFSRYFKKHTGKTYSDVLKEIRLGHAGRMLAESDMNVSRICYECGYNNLANFNRQFKDIIGKTPRAYRDSYKDLTRRV